MMTAIELKSIFENSYNRAEWITVLREVFHVSDIKSNPEHIVLPEDSFNANGIELGFFETSEGLVVGLYEVSINPEKKLERNKVGLRNLLRNVYKNNVDAALIVFTQGDSWRFTYVSELTVANKETGKREKRKTDPKRYTYIFGRHQLCRTAAERFAGIQTSTDLFGSGVSIKEIEKAFSVDLLTKDFYKELSNWYFWALQHVEFPDDAEKNQEIRNSTNTIRLITRLIFVWFLKQKGLVPEELFNPERILPQLNPGYKNDSLYYKAILQNLFFATLNQEMGKRGFRKGKQHYNITNLFRYEKYFKTSEETMELFKGIPFLNGGLFECLDKPHPTEKTPQGAEKILRIDGFSDRDDNPLSVPDYLFFGGADAVDLSMVYEDQRQKNVKVRGLIDILNSYNFTVEENTPLDIQVALDPELLGKVFENLLASYNPETKTTARKQTGSFYTPREIVQYMVDESLIAYLKQKLNKGDDAEINERDKSLIRELLSYSANGNPFSPEETRLLIEAIDQIKVLDPACGSGAFPMGVLQQLVHILQKLDPDNTEWKKIQMQRAQSELQDAIAIGDADNFSERIKEIAESFESNTEDYGRKLFLIENCIYGVDIQPIAVQIAKLRFFVSLLCEQTIQEEKENLGIRALPNLETKFVAANTLIALEKPVLGTGNLFLSDTQTEFEKLKKALNENRHKYFIAKRRDQKLKCHKIDKEIREKIAQLLVHEGWKTEIAKQVASYDPYNQNLHTDWFDPEWMLGVTDGFNIIIGNPPYRPIQKYDIEQKSIWANQKYKTYANSGNIYFLFFERGLGLVRLDGHVIYITSNQWMRNVSGKTLREIFLDNYCPELLVDFRGTDIFENVAVLSNIFLIANRKCKKSLIACDISAVRKKHYEEFHVLIAENSISLSPVKNEPWLIFNREKFNLRQKVIKKGTPLIKWGLEINYGIKTGFNDAFYLTKDDKDILVQADHKNEDIIWPMLRGRDLERYAPKPPQIWLINTYNGKYVSGGQERKDRVNVEKDYPILYKHLLKYKENLERRQDKGDHWTNLRSCDYNKAFKSPKMIFMNMSKDLIFSYDPKGEYFTNQKCFIVIGNHIRYLTAFFNSKLFAYFFKDNFPELLGDVREVSKVYFEQIPVLLPAKESTLNLIELLVDLVVFAKMNSIAETHHFEKVLDALIVELYFPEHLTERNINILDLVSADVNGLIQGKDFNVLSEELKIELVNRLNAKWVGSANEIITRIGLFEETSPEILKPIMDC